MASHSLPSRFRVALILFLLILPVLVDPDIVAASRDGQRAGTQVGDVFEASTTLAPPRPSRADGSWTTYSDAAHNVSFDYPASWHAVARQYPDAGGEEVLISAGDAVAIIVSYEANPLQLSADEWFAAQRSRYHALLIQELGHVTVQGQTGLVLGQPESCETAALLVVLLPVNENMITLTFYGYPSETDVLETLLQSLTFDRAATATGTAFDSAILKFPALAQDYDCASPARLSVTANARICPGASMHIPTTGNMNVPWNCFNDDSTCYPYKYPRPPDDPDCGDGEYRCKPHSGIDVFGGEGPGMTPVYATHSGTAHLIKQSAVRIDFGEQVEGSRSSYNAHMANNTTGESYRLVTEGQKVTGGVTIIGRQGNYNTGAGVHLHISYDDNISDWWPTLDPTPLLKADHLVYHAGWKYAGAPVTCTKANPIDVALILDSSGSMGGNDPQDLRKAAAKLFIGAMEDDDQVAVVDFDDSVRVPWPLQRVGSDRQQPLAAVDTVDSDGWTNILAALQTGFNQLKLSTASNPKAAVFLTDGYDTENNSDASILSVADSYAAKGWRIFTIGLIGPEGVDEDLLRQIAARTGGQYSRLASADQLVDVYFKLLGHATGGTTISDQTTILRPGQTQTIAVTMPGDQTTANFLTTWPGSTVDMTLIDPTGRVITPGIADQDPAIDHQKGLTYELYRVTAPQAGAWRVSIYGADLPASGEDVRVQVAVRAPRGGKTYLPLILSRYGGGTPITPTATPTATASRTRTPTPTVTPTVTPTAMSSTGIVEGKAFYDANGNGSMEAGEVGLAGAVLVLEQGGAVVYTATSDLTGQYSFRAVAPSQYQLREKTPPPGYLHNASFGLSFFVNANQTLSGDFFNVGHQQAPTPTPTFTPAVGSLVNGGFEAGSTLPTGWTNDAWTSGRTTFTWDNAQARSGSRSIKIVSNEENDARWVQTVAVQPQTDYRLSGCIKTENVPHRADGTDAGANLSLMGGWIRSPGVFGTTGWTCTSLTFNSGGDTQVIVAARLGFYAGTTTGAAWFDDLQLEKLGTPTPTSSPTPTETPTPYPQSISIQIFADNQDGMEDTFFSISGDSAHHNWVGVSSSVMTGWVFPMVYIPRGATITHAYLRTYGFGIAGNATTRIYGFAQDFAPVFAADGSNRPSTRPTTAAYVDWPKTWTFAWQWIETPNFANVVQEIVNRPGWVSGNTLGIRANIPSGTGTNWCSVDYAAGSGPTTLYISYLAP